MSVEQPEVAPADTTSTAPTDTLAPVRRRRAQAHTNPLAIAALILAALLSPFAALFGHIALGQIARSQGRERGVIPAWIAVGFGYLWLLGLVIVIGAVALALEGGGLPGL